VKGLRAATGPARQGLPDQVASWLLAAVAGGEYPAGSRLPPEAELAARATVSRLTLREAVKVLRDKGVLQVEQGRGTFVKPPAQWSPLDAELLASRTALEAGSGGRLIQQLTEARRVIEAGIAGLAAQRRTPQDVDRLAEIIGRMQAAHDIADVPAFSLADSAFHEGVLLVADNPFLTALFEPIRTLVHQVRASTSLESDMRQKAILAHTAILEAVSAGHEDQAWQAASAHVGETHRIVAEGYLEIAPLDPALAAPPSPSAVPDDPPPPRKRRAASARRSAREQEMS